ncbi:MAG TPA: hypothetical protein VFE53_26820 [Mucilaginibacter sp.]|jgi:signal peptidase I|nr:hypothetical protein [Mucilaginibacter sp.]
MKKHHRQIFFKSIVAVFLAAYLIGSFTNMLCIPRYVPDWSKVSVSSMQESLQTINTNFSRANFLLVFDKSNVDNEDINELSFMPKSFDISFRLNGLSMQPATNIQPQNHPYYNYQHSYLSFCTFRI